MAIATIMAVLCRLIGGRACLMSDMCLTTMDFMSYIGALNMSVLITSMPCTRSLPDRPIVMRARNQNRMPYTLHV